ncbi:MAG: glutamine synthetase type III, partial [Bacteroidetes bacterium]|nr:glutamine synthetase type III [Bacteroidota bacterium]
KLDIHNKIPDLLLDNTDRNRTSPFAFTGNKFEVRTVGSSANCAGPITVLNTIVADQLSQFKTEVDKLIKSGEKKDGAILHVLRNYITESKHILFEGDGYSKEWAKEAKKRGLSNIKTTPIALDAYITKKTKQLFARNKVLSEKEITARHEIRLENYIKKVQIESRITAELGMNYILPSAIKYQNELLTNINNLKEIGEKEDIYQPQLDIVRNISKHIIAIKSGVDEMVEQRKQANKIEDLRDMAIAYCDIVKPFIDKIRYSVDKLELMVDDKVWTLPKYRELLFIR